MFFIVNFNFIINYLLYFNNFIMFKIIILNLNFKFRLRLKKVYYLNFIVFFNYFHMNYYSLRYFHYCQFYGL
jgi:hypothetical protein